MVDERLTKNERRAAAREKAAQLRQKENKKRTTKLIAGWTSVTLGIAAVVAIAAVVIVGNTTRNMEASVTAPNNMASDGIILSSPTEAILNTGYNLVDADPTPADEQVAELDVPHIEIYADYACPHCATFEQTNSVYLTSLLEDGSATVEIKPINVLEAPLSYDGANAAACVANSAPEKFWEFNTNLFAWISENSPVSSGVRTVLNDLELTDDQKSAIQSCVRSGVYADWTETATAHALSRTDDNNEPLVTGTPTILVNGYKYNYGPSGFPTFMEAVLSGSTPAEADASLGGNS